VAAFCGPGACPRLALMKRRITARIAGAALAILMLAAAPVLAAGFEQATVPDPEGPPLEAGIWYPSQAPASSQPLGPYQQTVATGGQIAGRGLPLIVMSHSTGGSFTDHYDTALALAEAGFVVAAVTHTGDNFRDRSGFTRVENRPRHIKALVDYMLASWPHRDLIDPARIGMFGFSAGGFTALVVIGGVPDPARGAAHCAVYPDEWACRRVKESSGVARATSPVFVHDPRIAAAVIAAPALSYSFTPQALAGVKVPIQFWRPDSDEMFPHPRHAQYVHDALPTRPEYHVVQNAGHFVFLAPCSPQLERVASEICRDPAGFDRAAFHREFNPAVVAFFSARLPARP
jgi:predicted dienelactone hydrolase